jgi:hypothetical protein
LITELIPPWPALPGRAPQRKRYPISGRIISYNVGRVVRGTARRFPGRRDTTAAAQHAQS